MNRALVDPPRPVLVAVGAAVVLMPLLKPGGPANSSPVDVAILAAVVLTLAWALSTGQPVRLPYAIPEALLMGAGALAGLAGPFPLLSLTQVAQDLALLLWCGAIVNAARTAAALRCLLRIWAWSGLAWAALLVTAYMTGHGDLAGVTERLGPRASLTFGDPNLASSYFVLTLLAMWAGRCPDRNLARIGATGLVVAAMLLTGSNGGLLSLAGGTAAAGLWWIGQRWGPALSIASGAFAALVALLLLSNNGLRDAQLFARGSGQQLLADSIGRSDQSLAQRLTIVAEMADLYRQGTVLGWGPRSTKAVLESRQAPFPHEAHNDYLASFVERGLLGSLGLLLLAATLAWMLSRAFQNRQPEIQPAALLAALVAIALLATNEQVLHFRHVWAMFAVVAAAALWQFPRARGDLPEISRESMTNGAPA